MTWFLLIIGFLILALIAWLSWKVKQKRRLSASSAKRYRDAWKNVLAIDDEHRQILEAEKIIDSAMKELGYTGTFADKLRRAGPRFRDVQQLWNAHKLRNRIAHEMNLSLNGRDVKSALAAFERALKDLS